MSETGRFLAAARLAGATERMYELAGTPILPSFTSWVELLERSRQALGDRRFETLFAEGRSLERAAAIAFAIECLK